MPCLLGCLALLFPRVIILLVWLFGGGYFASAYQTVIWPVLGFIFMPITMLAYAFAMNANDGQLNGIYLILFVIAILIDLGLLGGGGAGARRRRR